MGWASRPRRFVWDGSSIGNTTEALLEEQKRPIPGAGGDLPTAQPAASKRSPSY